MSTRLSAFLLCSLASAAACATDAPICNGDADCAAKWGAAREFLDKNSFNKLQQDTEHNLSTYNTNDSALAGEVSREKQPDGSYKIVAVFGCHGVRDAKRCVPMSPKDALEAFNKFVGAATP